MSGCAAMCLAATLTATTAMRGVTPVERQLWRDVVTLDCVASCEKRDRRSAESALAGAERNLRLAQSLQPVSVPCVDDGTRWTGWEVLGMTGLGVATGAAIVGGVLLFLELRP